jgi:hypothetical protein
LEHGGRSRNTRSPFSYLRCLFRYDLELARLKDLQKKLEEDIRIDQEVLEDAREQASRERERLTGGYMGGMGYHGNRDLDNIDLPTLEERIATKQRSLSRAKVLLEARSSLSPRATNTWCACMTSPFSN